MLVPFTAAEKKELKTSTELAQLTLEAEVLPEIVKRAVLWDELKKRTPIPIEALVGPELVNRNEAADSWLKAVMEVFRELGRAYVLVIWHVPSIEGKRYHLGIISRANLGTLSGDELVKPDAWYDQILQFRNQVEADTYAALFFMRDVVIEFFTKKEEAKRLTEDTANAVAKTGQAADPTVSQLILAAGVLSGKAALQAQLDPKAFMALAMGKGPADMTPLLWLGLLLLLSQRK